MRSDLFLNSEEVADLTGRRQKSRQIDELRRMGVAFWINTTGHPKVARSAIEGKTAPSPAPRQRWIPNFSTP